MHLISRSCNSLSFCKYSFISECNPNLYELWKLVKTCQADVIADWETAWAWRTPPTSGTSSRPPLQTSSCCPPTWCSSWCSLTRERSTNPCWQVRRGDHKVKIHIDVLLSSRLLWVCGGEGGSEGVQWAGGGGGWGGLLLTTAHIRPYWRALQLRLTSSAHTIGKFSKMEHFTFFNFYHF